MTTPVRTKPFVPPAHNARKGVYAMYDEALYCTWCGLLMPAVYPTIVPDPWDPTGEAVENFCSQDCLDADTAQCYTFPKGEDEK